VHTQKHTNKKWNASTTKSATAKAYEFYRPYSCEVDQMESIERRVTENFIETMAADAVGLGEPLNNLTESPVYALLSR
jgi:hypothetical protein